MSRNQKVQVVFTLMILPFILGICLFGAKFLTDTIYLFLVQESAAADTSLMKQILGYISTYHLLHIFFIIVALITSGISIYVFVKDRSYKIGIFSSVMSLVVIIITLMNKGLLNLMGSARSMISNASDIIPYFELGKDFISVTSSASQTLPANATNIALKALVLDSVILAIFLLIFIVLVLRIIDLRRYEKKEAN